MMKLMMTTKTVITVMMLTIMTMLLTMNVVKVTLKAEVTYDNKYERSIIKDNTTQPYKKTYQKTTSAGKINAAVLI